jgi:hypothetical protein
MEITKEEEENYKKILISNNKSKLEMILNENNELIFYFNKKSLIIDKSNYEVYSAFIKLIQEIKTCSFLNAQENEIERVVECAINNNRDYHYNLKLYLKKKKENIEFIQSNNLYHNIVKDDNIIWQSDEDLASYFMIKQVNDDILIYSSTNMVSPYIIVLLDDSKQKPFNIPFFNLFNSLNNLDYEHHQIDVDEYLLKRKI